MWTVISSHYALRNSSVYMSKMLMLRFRIIRIVRISRHGLSANGVMVMSHSKSISIAIGRFNSTQPTRFTYFAKRAVPHCAVFYAAGSQEGGEGEEVRGPASTGQGGVGLLRVIKAAKKLVSKDGDDKLPNQPALGVVVSTNPLKGIG